MSVLTLWRTHCGKEVQITAERLIPQDIQYGIYKSIERPEPDMQGARLWVKDTDWELFLVNQGIRVMETGSGDSERAPAYKNGSPPTDEKILSKADEMKARGLNGYNIAKSMRLERGFEHVANTVVRNLIKGRYTGGRPKKDA